MLSAIGAMGLLDHIFLLFAVVGGLFTILRLVMMLIGMEWGQGVGVDMPHDLDVHAGDFGHHDADVSFKLLTIQGMAGGAMMFGLVGLMLSQGLGFKGIFSVFSMAGAITAGLGTAYAVARALSWMKSLETSGNVEEKDYIGMEGVVYLNIPANGVGKVHITVKNKLVEAEAESQNHVDLKTGEQVRVVFIKGNNLIVEKI